MSRRKGGKSNTPRLPRTPRSPKLCVYCSLRPAVKNEHVVGRIFFGSPLPSQMMTVPSCAECDSGRGDGGPRDFHLDENYVRDVLILREGFRNHPVVKKLTPNTIKSWVRSPMASLKVFANMPRVAMRTNDGSARTVRLMTVDQDRYARVIRKIVRGLYYKMVKKPLAPDAQIDVCPELARKAIDVYVSTMTGPWYGWSNGVFRYKYSPISGPPNSWIFLMVWYDRLASVAFVNYPRDRTRAPKLVPQIPDDDTSA